MNDASLNEIKNFWKNEIDEYDSIVEVKEMAYSDIYELITTIRHLRDERDHFKIRLKQYE